jgi:hypothetical protein
MTIRFKQGHEILRGLVLGYKGDGKYRIFKVQEVESGAILWVPVDWVLSE